MASRNEAVAILIAGDVVEVALLVDVCSAGTRIGALDRRRVDRRK
jgi:hypothetical protein